MPRTKREKGMEFQRWIRTWLIKRGWTCVNIPPRFVLIEDRKKKTKRIISLSNDIFGCDLIARKTFEIKYEFGPRKETRELWIQATASSKAGIGNKVEELKKYPFAEMIDTQVWIKIEPGKVNIYGIYKDSATGILRSKQIGKIIYAKYYSSEGEDYEY